MRKYLLTIVGLVLLCLLAALGTASASPDTITVSSTPDVLDAADDGDDVDIGDLPGSDTETSLREAICAASNNPGSDTIASNIPVSDTGYQVSGIAGPWTISLNSSLPSPTGGGTIISDTTPVDAAPDLNLTKTSEVSRGGIIVYPGDTITYTVCYSNSSSGTLAHNVVITDFIPANTTYVAASVVTNGTLVQFYSGTAWQPGEPAEVVGLRWIVGDLPADGNHCVSFQVYVNMFIVTAAGGSARTLQYTMGVSPTATVTPTVSIVPTAMTAQTQSPIVVQQLGTSGITNTATIDSDETEPESAEVYNPFPDVPLVNPVIGKIATPPYALPGQEVTFTMTVTNEGIAQAQNVWVTDTVPGPLEILDVIVIPWRPSSILAGNIVVVDIGTLDPNGTEVVTIIIRTRVRPGTPAGTLMDNWVVVTCDGGEDQDHATVQVLVDPVIGKIATPPYALPGQEVIFTLTVRNEGIAQAQNVWVTDTVPGSLEILDVIVTPWRPSSILPGNIVVVDIGTLDPYGTEVVTIIIRVRVRPGTPAGTLMDNWAVVTCDGGEDQDHATVQVPREDFVPEPGSMGLLASGLLGLAGYAALRLGPARRASRDK